MPLRPAVVAAKWARLARALQDNEDIHMHIVATRSWEYPHVVLAFRYDKRVCGTERCHLLKEFVSK